MGRKNRSKKAHTSVKKFEREREQWQARMSKHWDHVQHDLHPIDVNALPAHPRRRI